MIVQDYLLYFSTLSINRPALEAVVARSLLCSLMRRLSESYQAELLSRLMFVMSYVSYLPKQENHRANFIVHSAETLRVLLLIVRPTVGANAVDSLLSALLMKRGQVAATACCPAFRQDLLETILLNLPISILRRVKWQLIEQLPIEISRCLGCSSTGNFGSLLALMGGLIAQCESDTASKHIVAAFVEEKTVGTAILKVINALSQLVVSSNGKVDELFSSARCISFLARMLSRHSLPPPVRSVLSKCLVNCCDSCSRPSLPLHLTIALFDSIFSLFVVLGEKESGRELVEEVQTAMSKLHGLNKKDERGALLTHWSFRLIYASNQLVPPAWGGILIGSLLKDVPQDLHSLLKNRESSNHEAFRNQLIHTQEWAPLYQKCLGATAMNGLYGVEHAGSSQHEETKFIF
eukprot:scaffold2084_cov170-Ochromonas_danica.AAC.5